MDIRTTINDRTANAATVVSTSTLTTIKQPPYQKCSSQNNLADFSFQQNPVILPVIADFAFTLKSGAA
ncbi:MAG: hypothetical protein EOO10_22220 [Chitinophagaceae bacterium]|nr:MAG: hypothetical protein EOO10_22220 [Chitinophagaceae bacterium]